MSNKVTVTALCKEGVRETYLFPSLMKPVVVIGKRAIHHLRTSLASGKMLSCHSARSLKLVPINQKLPGQKMGRWPSVLVYLAIIGPKTCDKDQIPTFSIAFLPTSIKCNWLELGKQTTPLCRHSTGISNSDLSRQLVDPFTNFQPWQWNKMLRGIRS